MERVKERRLSGEGGLTRHLAAWAALALILTACQRPPRTSGPLPHEAYVWQRVWTPGVAAALSEGGASLRSFVVLAGEITFGAAQPVVVRPAVDYAALARAGRPVGLAIRVSPYPGPFRDDDSPARTITRIARERLAEARASGIAPVELQLDFDCAEAKLDGYRIWLRAVRKAVAPLPVRPTVLPSWLGRAEFAALARESGGYILQVHSVATPESGEKLTEPARAERWVEQAAGLAVPFRVALPTYTYLVAADAAGKVRGISAEGPAPRAPAGTRVSRWEADPAELAALVARWERDRPATLQGCLWYRLPVAGDALNWRWPTLSAVMRGRAPQRHLRVEINGTQPAEIFLQNAGEQDEPLPVVIEAGWDNGRLLGGDALDGYALENADASRVRFRRLPSAELSRLPPGGRRNIGWLRFESTPSLRLSVLPAVAGDAREPAASARRDGL